MSLEVSLFFRPHQVPGGDPTAIIDVARAADDAGLRDVHFGDHLLMGQRPDRYPYGAFQMQAETPWLEPMTVLAAISAVTTRLRLSAGVLLAPLRPAILLAKTIATLDVVSRGRVELGIGTGWQREEYAAAGLAWGDRYQIFDDSIAACRQLWEQAQPATFSSPTVNFEDVYAYPQPVQRRIPLLYGVRATRANARRIATLGDGWCPVSADLGVIREGTALIREEFEHVGRDSASLLVRAHAPHVLAADGRIDVRATLAQAPQLHAAGVNIVCIGPPVGLEDMAAVYRFIAEVGAVASSYDRGQRG